jgi:hypothetical protein
LQVLIRDLLSRVGGQKPPTIGRFGKGGPVAGAAAVANSSCRLRFSIVDPDATTARFGSFARSVRDRCRGGDQGA